MIIRFSIEYNLFLLIFIVYLSQLKKEGADQKFPIKNQPCWNSSFEYNLVEYIQHPYIYCYKRFRM